MLTYVCIVATLQIYFAGSCLFATFPNIQDLTSGQLDQIFCPSSLSVMDRLSLRMCDAVVEIGMHAIYIVVLSIQTGAPDQCVVRTVQTRNISAQLG